MRRRSWAWAAEHRPATAAKARRWPRRRPRSMASRGSVGICGSFIEAPGGPRRDKVVPPRLINLFILKELIGIKRKKTGQIRPVYRSSHVRGSPPDSMVRQGWASYGGPAGRGYGGKWFRWIWLRGRK